MGWGFRMVSKNILKFWDMNVLCDGIYADNKINFGAIQ